MQLADHLPQVMKQIACLPAWLLALSFSGINVSVKWWSGEFEIDTLTVRSSLATIIGPSSIDGNGKGVASTKPTEGYSCHWWRVHATSGVQIASGFKAAAAENRYFFNKMVVLTPILAPYFNWTLIEHRSKDRRPSVAAKASPSQGLMLSILYRVLTWTSYLTLKILQGWAHLEPVSGHFRLVSAHSHKCTSFTPQKDT